MQVWDFIIVGLSCAACVLSFMFGYNAAANEANARIRAAARLLGPEAQAEFVRALAKVRAEAGE